MDDSDEELEPEEEAEQYRRTKTTGQGGGSVGSRAPVGASNAPAVMDMDSTDLSEGRSCCKDKNYYPGAEEVHLGVKFAQPDEDADRLF